MTKTTAFDIEKFCSGSTEQFIFIFKTYYKALYGYISRMDAQDLMANEDIVTETFVTLWKSRKKFESENNIKSFLYICARNALFNHLGREKRWAKSHLEIKYLSTEADEIDYNAINSEVFRQIEADIKKLPFMCGKIFCMYFYEQLKTSEIAKRLNLAEKTVLNQKLKAIGILKKSLKEHQFTVLMLFV